MSERRSKAFGLVLARWEMGARQARAAHTITEMVCRGAKDVKWDVCSNGFILSYKAPREPGYIVVSIFDDDPRSPEQIARDALT